ncbi:MAG: hypothetical protein KJ646_05370 [Nanoarchaeota archaeon]|nr:hypothetical protein [Nanoarchaeota archaeon]
MIEIKTKLRKWGNSFGIVVPQQAIMNAQAKEGDELTILLKKDEDNVLKEMFNSFKFKKSPDKILKEVDKELENE